MSKTTDRHIRLSSHSAAGAKPPPLHWGAADPAERGPVVGAPTPAAGRNVIGSYGGAYSLYRALSIATGAMGKRHRPDLSLTAPAVAIGPFPQWSEAGRIVSLDPFGHLAAEAFADLNAAGADIRPTIAVTRAKLRIAEIEGAVAAGRLKADGRVVAADGALNVVKAAVDPVWHLPGVAARLGVAEHALRRALFEETGGMFPDLVTRPDIEVFLPPIGGVTVYIMGDPAKLGDPATRIACRVHDECSGSDVFGSDVCTCRPYLIHGVEAAAAEAQAGGLGLVVYTRKEGRALGEVTKFLVYNARKRHPDGDLASAYFERTECVAGVQDARFQDLMPDVLHWLGMRRIDRFVSMSDMKHDAIVGQGIEIVERVPIPADRVPLDAQVEIAAKVASGYAPLAGAPESAGPSAPAESGPVAGRRLEEF